MHYSNSNHPERSWVIPPITSIIQLADKKGYPHLHLDAGSMQPCHTQPSNRPGMSRKPRPGSALGQSMEGSITNWGCIVSFPRNRINQSGRCQKHQSIRIWINQNQRKPSTFMVSKSRISLSNSSGVEHFKRKSLAWLCHLVQQITIPSDIWVKYYLWTQ